MTPWNQVAAYLRLPDPRPIGEIEEDIRAELEFHLEMRAQDNVRAGMPLDEARADALRRFGDFDRIRRTCRRIQLGDRIMLQRIQAVLTAVLLVAVVVLGVLVYRMQTAQETQNARLLASLEQIAQRPAVEVVAAPDAGPVVLETTPVTGAKDVDPSLDEIRVVFSKTMMDQSWSFSTSEDEFPETIGEPRYLADGKTCVLPVKLEPGKTYGIWLNSNKFGNFKDAGGRSAEPYLLKFTTRP